MEPKLIKLSNIADAKKIAHKTLILEFIQTLTELAESGNIDHIVVYYGDKEYTEVFTAGCDNALLALAALNLQQLALSNT
jgi:hypothetical protein